jgi:hypothetical protein
MRVWEVNRADNSLFPSGYICCNVSNDKLRKVLPPDLSAIIEQDEAPVIIADDGGFFVSGVLFRAI